MKWHSYIAALAAAVASLSSAAQPVGPTLRLVVPVPAGGVTDLAARAGRDGAQGDPRLPDIPTSVEAGLKNFTGISWIGLLAPPATPARTVDRLNTALNQGLAVPTLRQRLQEMGLSTEAGDVARLLTQVREDVRLHRQIAERARPRFE